MRQALHIFKKDARYLRWELVLLAIFLAMFVYTETHYDESEDPIRSTAMPVALGCVWALVCARLMQAETIPGDRQFWITRPYSWTSLLGAKLLFIVVFLGMPLLVADAVILGREGFSVEANAAGLVWSALLVTIGWLTTLCAFATLMRNIPQWMLVALLAMGAFFGLGEIASGNLWGGVEWSRNLGGAALLFALAAAVLLWQYRRRGTEVSRVAMAAGLLAIWLCWDRASPVKAFEVQARFSAPKVDPSAIQVAFHEESRGTPKSTEAYGIGKSLPAEYEAASSSAADGGTKFLAIPLDLSGLERGMNLTGDCAKATFELPGDEGAEGSTWTTSGNVLDRLERQDNGLRVILHIDDEFFKKSVLRSATIRLTLYLTLLGNPTVRLIEAGAKPVPIPGLGTCSVYDQDTFRTIRCVSPLREPSNVMVVRFGRERQDWFLTESSYSPLCRRTCQISPLRWYWRSVAQDSALLKDPLSTRIPGAVVTSLEPLAHLRRDLVLPRDASLNDYLIPPNPVIDLLENQLRGGAGERDVLDLVAIALFVADGGVEVLGRRGFRLHVGFDAGLFPCLTNRFVVMDFRASPRPPFRVVPLTTVVW